VKFKLSQQAASYLKRLDKPTKQRIDNALLEALRDPIGASDHLINRGDERSIRVGGLRILFRVVTEKQESESEAAQSEIIIVVDAILPRGDVYKHTRR
jgi:mRNA-degrading endonuclease RelE of RelBE toxin-antitoxin system